MVKATNLADLRHLPGKRTADVEDGFVGAQRHGRNRRRACRRGLVVAAAVAFAAARGTTNQSGSPSSERPAGSVPGTLVPPARAEFAGLVTIGDGRQLFVQCRG